MNNHLIILGIAVLLICVGLSGCVKTEEENGTQGEEKVTTLPDGTRVTGDFDKLKILNYSIVTEKEVTNYTEWPYTTYEKIADGFVYSENASRYRIYGTTKNIAGKIITDIKITVKYYDNNNIYLSSKSDTLGIFDPDIPDTYTWDFEIIYDKKTIFGVDEYFEYVDHIGGFEISVS